MLTVEGFFNGDSQAAALLRVIVQHFRPGDRLQYGPVPTGDKKHRQSSTKETESVRHKRIREYVGARQCQST